MELLGQKLPIPKPKISFLVLVGTDESVYHYVWSLMREDTEVSGETPNVETGDHHTYFPGRGSNQSCIIERLALTTALIGQTSNSGLIIMQ